MEKRKKKFRDRHDGYRVTELDGLHNLICYIKPKRSSSDVYINQKLDVTELVKYMEKKKQKNKDIKITYFHAFVMALSKMVYNRPLLNRFIVNKNFYDRNNITISYVAKVAFEDYSKELMAVLDVKDDYTINDISVSLNNQVKSIRDKKEPKKDGANDIINMVGKLPRFMRTIIMWIFKKLDNHDLLPRSLTENDIYHSTLLVSNLGSIGCGAILHNLTDFGTNSILITIGEIKKEKVLNKDNSEEIRDIVEFGINIDERIADGFYFVKSLKTLEYILNNPTLLESKLCSKIKVE